MQPMIGKNVEKILRELNKLNAFTKVMMKYGVQAFLGLLAVGTFLLVYNHVHLGFDAYFDFIAKAIVKNSFIVLAEVVIGGLVVDYIFKKV